MFIFCLSALFPSFLIWEHLEWTSFR